jgi:hypothetical protein
LDVLLDVLLDAFIGSDSVGRKTTIDVTDLIWKRAQMAAFSLHRRGRSSREHGSPAAPIVADTPAAF